MTRLSIYLPSPYPRKASSNGLHWLFSRRKDVYITRFAVLCAIPPGTNAIIGDVAVHQSDTLFQDEIV